MIVCRFESESESMHIDHLDFWHPQLLAGVGELEDCAYGGWKAKTQFISKTQKQTTCSVNSRKLASSKRELFVFLQRDASIGSEVLCFYSLH
jgi:hypothetical protein